MIKRHGAMLFWLASTGCLLSGFFSGLSTFGEDKFQRQFLLSSAYATLSPGGATLTFPVVTKEKLRDWPETYAPTAEKTPVLIYNPEGNSGWIFSGQTGEMSFLSGLASVSTVKGGDPDDKDKNQRLENRAGYAFAGLCGLLPGYCLGLLTDYLINSSALDGEAKKSALREEAINQLYNGLADDTSYYLDHFKPNETAEDHGRVDELTKFIRLETPHQGDRAAVHAIFFQYASDPSLQRMMRPRDHPVNDFCHFFAILGLLLWMGSLVLWQWPNQCRRFFQAVEECIKRHAFHPEED